mmetsp:Transcript_4167/g.17140  ORF Transcript_4167/g.17140 Transcript_4167/m.17140 type:complete len:302 (-) Transcript_4167:92-997(-)
MNPAAAGTREQRLEPRDRRAAPRAVVVVHAVAAVRTGFASPVRPVRRRRLVRVRPVGAETGYAVTRGGGHTGGAPLANLALPPGHPATRSHLQRTPRRTVVHPAVSTERVADRAPSLGAEGPSREGVREVREELATVRPHRGLRRPRERRHRRVQQDGEVNPEVLVVLGGNLGEEDDREVRRRELQAVVVVVVVVAVVAAAERAPAPDASRVAAARRAHVHGIVAAVLTVGFAGARGVVNLETAQGNGVHELVDGLLRRRPREVQAHALGGEAVRGHRGRGRRILQPLRLQESQRGNHVTR